MNKGDIMECKVINGKLVIKFNGSVDSVNSPKIEKQIMIWIEDNGSMPVVLDAEKLKYISSAGLRVILRLRKKVKDLRVINVSSDVYEIFDMTGFTEMMPVDKAYRVVSVDGCEEIGRGSNGIIYRIDRDTVVKVYKDANALEDIRHEREVARLALILGIPTAISYDVVKVGESYGSVFELLNARSFSEIIAQEPEKMDWCIDEYVAMLKKIHSTVVPDGKLPDMKSTVLSWAKYLQGHIPDKAGQKLVSLVEQVPVDNHMLHGDYHTKNLELQDDEVLLIDMDTLAVGHPIFELASMFNAFIGFHELDHDNVKRFQGFDFETSLTFWKKTLIKYLGTDIESKLKEVEDKARIIGYTRLIRRSIKRDDAKTQNGRKELDYRINMLLELIEKYDTLLFSCNEIDVEAETSKLPEVLDFIEKHLEKIGCLPRDRVKIGIAAEEIFVNIAQYAYAPEKGRACVRIEVSDDPVEVTITFIDNGKPYDPLKNEDPDITLPASERPIGGLGVFMVKKTMDDVSYKYVNGRNILRLKKTL